MSEQEGQHLIASQKGADVAVAILANATGVRVCKYANGELSDESTADIEYDPCANLWVGKSPHAGKSDKSPKVDSDTAARKPESRSAVAVVAELVVNALKKAEGS